MDQHPLSSSANAEAGAKVIIDGQAAWEMQSGDTLEVQTAGHPLHLVSSTEGLLHYPAKQAEMGQVSGESAASAHCFFLMPYFFILYCSRLLVIPSSSRRPRLDISRFLQGPVEHFFLHGIEDIVELHHFRDQLGQVEIPDPAGITLNRNVSGWTSSGSIRSSLHRMAARSMVFSSSLTLPSQGRVTSSRRASGEICRFSLPGLPHISQRNARPTSGISSIRSRRAGSGT